jgi:hypothetical protein
MHPSSSSSESSRAAAASLESQQQQQAVKQQSGGRPVSSKHALDVLEAASKPLDVLGSLLQL